MADNYCTSSSFIPIPPGKIDAARVILARVLRSIDEDPNEMGLQLDAKVEDKGVWVWSDGCFLNTQAERVFVTLINELALDGVFHCSWAYTCSKPRVDEFGGGAFVVVRGHPTVWVDALGTALNDARKLIEL